MHIVNILSIGRTLYSKLVYEIVCVDGETCPEYLSCILKKKKTLGNHIWMRTSPADYSNQHFAIMTATTARKSDPEHCVVVGNDNTQKRRS